MRKSSAVYGTILMMPYPAPAAEDDPKTAKTSEGERVALVAPCGFRTERASDGWTSSRLLIASLSG